MVKNNNTDHFYKNKYIVRTIVIIVTVLIICYINIFCLSKDNNSSNNDIPDKENSNTAEVQQETQPGQDTFEPKEQENQEEQKDTNKESFKIKTNSEDEQQPKIDTSNLYPELRCTRPATQTTPLKTIFLTFDDGPSERTPEILDILNKYGIKATFFVTGNASAQGKAWMKRIVDEGHAIGIHTYTHNFKQIYASVPAFLEDFNNIYNLIYEATGVKPTIFRFPGGSKNSFNKNNYRELITEMTNRGFDYFDWNLSAGDAVSKTPTPAAKCASNILNYSAHYNDAVVLMHDARPKRTTVEALPTIIEGLKNQGFSFGKLSHNIKPEAYSLVKPYK